MNKPGTSLGSPNIDWSYFIKQLSLCPQLNSWKSKLSQANPENKTETRLDKMEEECCSKWDGSISIFQEEKVSSPPGWTDPGADHQETDKLLDSGQVIMFHI